VLHGTISNRGDIGQILRNAGLLQESLFGATHGGVDQTIHGLRRFLPLLRLM
jgi:hypothetical protein